jgi:predicted nucleic acid-binding protein
VRFVVTNVLLYLVSKEGDKAERAREPLRSRDLALSAPMPQEFYVEATRATRDDALTHEQASRLVESFLRFPVQEMTVAIARAAMATKARFGISHWDDAIIEAARELGRRTVLSEDLSCGQDYDGVRVENPFL